MSDWRPKHVPTPRARALGLQEVLGLDMVQAQRLEAVIEAAEDQARHAALEECEGKKIATTNSKLRGENQELREQVARLQGAL